MPAVTGRRPPWGVHPSGSVVRGGVSGRPGSGQLVASSGVRPSSCLVSARPGSSRPVSARPVASVSSQRPAVTLGTRSVQRGNRYDCNGSSSMWSAASPGGLVDGRAGLDAGATAQVVRRSAGRRPRPGRMVLRLGRRPRSTAAPTGQGGQPTVRGARWWRLRQGRGAGCSATFPHLPRGGRPGLAARPRCVVVMEPGARSGRPGRANELAGEDGVRPSAAQACTERHGPGAGSALSWETVVGATGFEPVTSSVSDPRDHFQGGIPRHYRP
jgi:hypothetical protein